MLSILPPHIWSIYTSLETLLRQLMSNAKEMRSIRSCMFAGDSEYMKVVQNLRQKGIIVLGSENLKVVKSILAVPKGGGQRLIIDVRKSNLYSSPTPEIVPPNPDRFVDLCLTEEFTIYCGKTDMGNFYHVS